MVSFVRINLFYFWIRMVKEIVKGGNKYYQCGECKLIYKMKRLAERCEDWCEKNKSCNLEIIKNAVKL